MRVVSVNVGLPVEVEWRGKTVRTGIFKSPVSGPVEVLRDNLRGDRQAEVVGRLRERRTLHRRERVGTLGSGGVGAGRLVPQVQLPEGLAAAGLHQVELLQLPERGQRV